MVSKKLLFKEYVENNKPMWQIAKEQKIAVGTVFNYLKRYKIPRRKAMTEETKKKISETKKGKPSPNKGMQRTEETKRKISEARKGKIYVNSEHGGHEKKHIRGYTYVYKPNHPNATKEGYVFKHILAYEKYHNCIVDRKKFSVHHIDENKDNNEKENLLLMTKSEHMSYHSKKRHEKRRKEYVTQ